MLFLQWEKVVKAGRGLGNAFKEFTGDIISAASQCTKFATNNIDTHGELLSRSVQ